MIVETPQPGESPIRSSERFFVKIQNQSQIPTVCMVGGIERSLRGIVLMPARSIFKNGE